MSTNQKDKDVLLDAWGLSIANVVTTKPKSKSTKSTRYKPKTHKQSVSNSSKLARSHTQIAPHTHSHKSSITKTNTVAYNKKPKPKPIPTRKPNTSNTIKQSMDKRFEWLLQPHASKVLHKREINDILSHKSLNGYQRNMSTDRINNILQYNNCIETRKWCGLCKYDSDIRIEGVIEELTSYKKVLDSEMRKLFAIPNVQLTDKQKQRRTIVVKAIKLMQTLLLSYHQLVKLIRQKQRDNNEKNKMRNHCHNNRMHGHGNNNQGQMNERSDMGNGNRWTFGKSLDKWNRELNSEFCTLYRGHLLSDYDYNMYVNLKQSERDNEFSDSDIDIEINDNEYSVSILGPSASVPPGMNAVKIFRRKTNNHQSRFSSNLKLLYGNNSDLISTNGIYRSHLLSEYDILNRVGSGVYGCVFKAKTKRTNKIVAIKTLQLLLNAKQRETIDFKQSKLLDKELVNNICPYMMIEGIPVPVIREIMSLKNLNHINITQLYDIVLNDPYESGNKHGMSMTDDDNQWNFHLVQEFVPNELYAIMRNLKLLHFERNKFNSQFRNKNIDQLTPETLPQPPYWFSCANIKSIMWDLLQGLKYLESESYIHRDLKPSNLLLTDDGVVKIADFGLSRPKYKNNELLTNAHNVVTRYYRAPEILVEQNKRRSSYSFASDMWSIGCIFGELICGRPLFRAPNDIEQIFHIIHKCGSITDLVWNGISHVLTEDPPSDFIKINPITKQPNIWIEGHKKFNFIKNMRESYKNKQRMLISFLRPYICNSWTQENIKNGLDLIDKMLCYDSRKRITPKQALNHKWFQISPNRQLPKELIKKSRKSKKSAHTDLQKEQHTHQQQKKNMNHIIKQQQIQQQQQQQQQQLQRQNHRNNNNQQGNRNRYMGNKGNNNMGMMSNRGRNNNMNVHSAHSKRFDFFADARQKYMKTADNGMINSGNNIIKRPFNAMGNNNNNNRNQIHGHHHNNPHKKRRVN